MAGEAGFFLIFVIIVILVWFLSQSIDQERRTGIKNELWEIGYRFDKSGSMNAFNAQKNISFYLENYTEGSGDDAQTWYRTTLKANVDDHFEFKITKRGFLSQMFDVNKGVLPEQSNYNVQTSNPHHTQLLLSQSEVFSSIQRILNHAKRIKVATRLNETSIIVESKREKNIVVTIVRSAEILISKMRGMNYLDFQFTEEMSYQCFSCGREITYDGDYCHYCGVLAPKCVICFEDPDPNDDVMVFKCCKSYVHQDHGIAWLSDNNECPYCKYKKPELIRVVETKKIIGKI